MAGVTKVTLEMRLDELGEYAREIWQVLVLLQQNNDDLQRNALELRSYRRQKRSPLFIRGIERERRKLVYTHKCLRARLELVEVNNEEKRQEFIGFH